MTLVLGSGSSARRRLLENAGIAFEVERANVDERAIEEPLRLDGATPEDIATALAGAKALDIAARRPGDLIIGADQVLAMANGGIVHKPDDAEAAAGQLRDLAGKDHWLHSAVVLARGTDVMWHHVASARLRMRALDGDEIARYLADVPLATLTSSGVYQIEGPGIRLFDDIEGDFFGILGLPLLPLLGALRDAGLPA